MQDIDIYVIRPNVKARAILDKYQGKSNRLRYLDVVGQKFDGRVIPETTITERILKVKLDFMMTALDTAFFVPRNVSMTSGMLEQRAIYQQLLAEFFGDSLMLSVDTFDQWWTIERINHSWHHLELFFDLDTAVLDQIGTQEHPKYIDFIDST